MTDISVKTWINCFFEMVLDYFLNINTLQQAKWVISSGREITNSVRSILCDKYQIPIITSYSADDEYSAEKFVVLLDYASTNTSDKLQDEEEDYFIEREKIIRKLSEDPNIRLFESLATSRYYPFEMMLQEKNPTFHITVLRRTLFVNLIKSGALHFVQVNLSFSEINGVLHKLFCLGVWDPKTYIGRTWQSYICINPHQQHIQCGWITDWNKEYRFEFSDVLLFKGTVLQDFYYYRPKEYLL